MLSRGLKLGCMTVVLLSALGQMASAQSFSFGISSGHGHHGHHHGRHHHHHHGPAWGFSYYRPAPVYVYPAAPPVTYVYPAAPVAVVQPAPQYSAAPIALPAPPTRTASTPINSVPLASRAEVTIRNPAQNGGPVAFIVGEQLDAELASGTTRTWSDRASLTVEFDRGGNYGSTKKILRPGQYDFVVTDEGWDIVAAGNDFDNVASGKSSQVQRNSLPARR